MICENSKSFDGLRDSSANHNAQMYIMGHKISIKSHLQTARADVKVEARGDYSLFNENLWITESVWYQKMWNDLVILNLAPLSPKTHQ